MTTVVEVSIGELLDKFSILEIKSDEIQDPVKQLQIKTELRIISPKVEHYIGERGQVEYEYKILKFLNKSIWKLNDQVCNLKSFDGKNIMELNNARFRTKARINERSESNIREVKSYDESCVYVNTRSIIGSEFAFAYKFAKWKLLFYDVVYIIVDHDQMQYMRLCFGCDERYNIHFVSRYPEGANIIDMNYDEIPKDALDILV